MEPWGGRDVFISYSREDRAAARHFAQSLADEGLSVWWDAALHSGETFDEVIERELRAAKAVIVLWSPRSVGSRWVRAEATLADRQHKLVPVAIESCDRPIIFELTHTNDLADWTGDIRDARWKALVGDVRRLVGHGPSESSAVIPNPAEPAPRKPQYRSPAVDDFQATQFYTGANTIDMFHCLEIDGGHDFDQALRRQPDRAPDRARTPGRHCLDRQTSVPVSLPGRTCRRWSARIGPQLDQRHLY